eukprot:gene4563-14742_t
MRYYKESRHELPSDWETKATVPRNQAALSLLKVEGLRVRYTGPGDDDKSAATIMSNFPTPVDIPLFYFEVEILSNYHGDDGCAFSGSGRGSFYGSGFGTGDKIGALFNRSDRTISFYKNGLDLGVAFREVNEERLHPCVGMRSRNEEILVNFGAQPFTTDLDAAQASFKEKVCGSVLNVSLPLISCKGSPLIPQLIHDYLLHHRCWQTASIVAKDLLGGQEGVSHDVPAQDIASRQQEEVSHNVLAQDLPAAGRRQPRCASPGDSILAEEDSHDVLAQDIASQQQEEDSHDVLAQDIASQQQEGDSHDVLAQDIASRQQVYELVVSGKIEEALERLKELYAEEPLEANPGLHFRLKVYELVVSRKIKEALEQLKELYAEEPLEANPGSHFTLKVAQFCEIVRKGADAVEEGLAFGRQVLATHTPKTAADDELLADALSLFAYEHPEESPCGHLMTKDARVSLAEDLNGAMMAHRGLPAASPLERIFQQATVALGALKNVNNTKSSVLDISKMCFGSTDGS